MDEKIIGDNSRATTLRYERQKLVDVIPLFAPFKLNIDPCGYCNFKCNFCPCNNSNEMIDQRHQMMEWPLFEKIVNDLKEFNGQVKVINLFAQGEPLLNPRIADMVKELKQNRICREVRITTNGSLLNEKMSKSLVDAGVDLIRISLEALNEEDYWKICQSPVSFEQIKKNIEYCYHVSRGSATRVEVKIINTMLRTQEDINFFYDTFENISDFTQVQEEKQMWIGFKAKDQYLKNIAVSSEFQGNIVENSICTMPFTEMSILSDGSVVMCSIDWLRKTKYANINYETLFSVWNGQKLRNHRFKCLDKSFDSSEICAACNYRCLDVIEDTEVEIIKKSLL